MSDLFVLDSWAVLAWLGAERPAVGVVRGLLEKAEAGDIDVSMSIMNAGEVYYLVGRRAGPEVASKVKAQLAAGPVRLVSVDDELVWAAAELKATYTLAYADAFAAALARRSSALLVTGDPEFKPLQKTAGLEVRWLSRRKR
jgi:ribonuclease VapC